MRTGEVHGLKWKYIDWDLRIIRVRETFVLGEDEYTKTDGSQRDIQMSLPVIEALKRQYVVRVNYPGRSASTILAGGGGEFVDIGLAWLFCLWSPFKNINGCLASEARQAVGICRGAVGKPRTP